MQYAIAEKMQQQPHELPPTPLPSLSVGKLFEKAFHDKLLPDVTLRAFEREYKAHRIVLIAHSAYFEKKFCNWDHREPVQEDVQDAKVAKKNAGRKNKLQRTSLAKDVAAGSSTEVQGAPSNNNHNNSVGHNVYDVPVGDDITLTGFEFVLQALYYSDKMVLTADNIKEVLCSAQYFEVKELEQQCVRFILGNLTPDNLLGWYHWAKDSSHPEDVQSGIVQGCHTLLSISMPTNFETWKPVIAQLDRAFMADLLKSSTLAVQDEYERFQLAKKTAELLDANMPFTQVTQAGSSYPNTRHGEHMACSSNIVTTMHHASMLSAAHCHVLLLHATTVPTTHAANYFEPFLASVCTHPCVHMPLCVQRGNAYKPTEETTPSNSSSPHQHNSRHNHSRG